jgi:hypothetical protein
MVVGHGSQCPANSVRFTDGSSRTEQRGFGTGLPQMAVLAGDRQVSRPDDRRQ